MTIDNFNHLSFLDKIFGIRAIGLILYGALPSNLALLGAFEIKMIPISSSTSFFILLSSFLPIFITFLLIRSRNSEWYLTTDYHNLRSLIITLTILFIATSIIGISGIINNKYIFGIPTSLSWIEWTGIVESFLLAVVSLIISSTFFVTALTKEVNLPGLPSPDFVKLMKELKFNMRQMKKDKIWEDYVDLDDSFINLMRNISQCLNQITTITGNKIAKNSLVPIFRDVMNMIDVVEKIKASSNDESKEILWKTYFSDFQNLSDDQKTRRTQDYQKYSSIERLKKLKL